MAEVRTSRAAEPAVWLRPAVAGERDIVERLLSDAGLPTAGVADQFEDGFVMAESENELVGAAGLETYGAYGLLRSVVVRPELRGRGVGEMLVVDRVERARSRGLQSVYLLTTTAAPFFARLGFSTISRERVPDSIAGSAEFAEICPSTATAMVIALTAPEAGCCGAPPVALEDRAGASGSGCCGAPASSHAVPRSADVPGVVLSHSAAGSNAEALKAQVRERYGAAAAAAASGRSSSCCGASPAKIRNPITSDFYAKGETQELPAEAVLASLGCGNPSALAELQPGETVLDLGSGGGIDVLLSAQRVGPTGRAYGLDMTDEMLALARANQQRAGAENVEFLKGDIEAIPLPDESVDVIISNCVINLAADKGRVLREAFRVLRPGGRFAVSDIVASRPVPPLIRRSMELWLGCVAGALEVSEYERLLTDAGFRDISVESRRVYRAEDAARFMDDAGGAAPAAVTEYDGAFISAFVRARKPAA
jgi:ubiquinone/menaquinone biosynthesis C-methylase UbiE/N-acetylglutamate synthase-like GNAT family acetyltransferase